MHIGFRRKIGEFLRDHGYLLVTGACVLVIIWSALWTDHMQTIQTQDDDQSRSAAQLMQQSMAEAAQETPEPALWCAPLTECVVLTAFHDHDLIPWANGIWQVHEAVDYQAEAGAEVHAVCPGTVVRIEACAPEVFLAEIAGADAVVTVYAGLSENMRVHVGDQVYAGDVIGTVSEAAACGAVSGTYLHVQMSIQGKPVDPADYF